MSWFAIRKKQKHERKVVRGESKDIEPQLTGAYRPPSNSSIDGKDENGRPTPSPTDYNLPSRETSSSPSYGDKGSTNQAHSSVQSTKQMFESLSSKSLTNSPDHSYKGGSTSPEKTSLHSARYSGSYTTPTHGHLRSSSRRNRQSGMSIASHGSFAESTPISGYTPQINIENTSFEMKLEVGKEKEFPHVKLKLPPLQTSRVRHRLVTSSKNPVVGGFGFNLRKAFQPHSEDPEKPLLVHLVEPRPNYFGPLMTGDRILEVNRENVENAPHERVVELIKSSGDIVEMKVASVPELMELNERGVFDDTGATISTGTRSGSIARKIGKPGIGTLRKTAVERRSSTFHVCKIQTDSLELENVHVVLF